MRILLFAKRTLFARVISTLLIVSWDGHVHCSYLARSWWRALIEAVCLRQLDLQLVCIRAIGLDASGCWHGQILGSTCLHDRRRPRASGSGHWRAMYSQGDFIRVLTIIPVAFHYHVRSLQISVKKREKKLSREIRDIELFKR
ncbi:hypothetical protein DFH11DRAFT_1603027 [Phellopilus nigrolimitatus]|nr:hypothetical protein DFH11DRAFT_1603027 [Phellopilus nigrolimitatus]